MGPLSDHPLLRPGNLAGLHEHVACVLQVPAQKGSLVQTPDHCVGWLVTYTGFRASNPVTTPFCKLTTG